ncbi:acyl-protein thioesterase 1-like [Babylonia areolata]|uniref:acyl-protein thioesterase 1-like n=1 Tax=Babylonia areolata TaxID=304850 RepID=UPI003FD3503A
MSLLRNPCQLFNRLFSSLIAVERTFMGASSSQTMNTPAVVQSFSKDHKATLIFLHGLGDTGDGWAEGFQMLSLKHIKCVCPHAPVQSVTLNAGMKMPSWFDIQGLSPSSQEDEAGIKEASRTLQALIESEVKSGIPRNKIFIGGFSQGGAVALYTAFTVDKPVGGIVALSTWLPLHKKLTDEKVTKYNKDVPILQCHGTSDPLVQFSWGQRTNHFIQSFNPKIEFKTYPGMMHSSCPQEMQDVKAFLEKHTAS